MIKKITLVGISIASAFFTTLTAFAQNILYADLNASPLAVNPAFTGMFNGDLRASAVYGNKFTGSELPYTTYGASFDMPVFTDSKGSYLAVGLQVMDIWPGYDMYDAPGYKSHYDLSGLASVAYHKLFGRSNHHNDLAIGMQAGYNKVNVNDESVNYLPNYNRPNILIGNYNLNYYSVNAGICYTHETGAHFNYTAGIAGYNLDQPNEATEQQRNINLGIDRRYIGEIGAKWTVTDWLELRPEILYESRLNTTDLIIGNEFNYHLNKKVGSNNNTSIFAGVWYNNIGTIVIAGGVEYKSLRLGVDYGINISSFIPTDENAGEGLAVSLKYIPTHKGPKHNHLVSNSRF